MKQIRTSVFETNSSSTHSLCVAIGTLLEAPDELHFSFGQFGWEEARLDSLNEKASYLYTALATNDRMDLFQQLQELLQEKGVKVTFEEFKYEETQYGRIAVIDGYIDHDDQLKTFLSSMQASPEMILDFLLSPLSFVLTGNDNYESDVEIKVDYPHEQFFKGN